MLAADGKLSLDDEVHKYVPELPRYRSPGDQVVSDITGSLAWFLAVDKSRLL
jgi:CubicO group peptidase (beta-lactamase class C family)